jgi:hypothetical protein
MCYKQFQRLRFEAVTKVTVKIIKNTIFWNVTPASQSNILPHIHRRRGIRSRRAHPKFQRNLQAILKMEVAGSSETLVNAYQNTWRHIPLSQSVIFSFMMTSHFNSIGADTCADCTLR